MGLTLKLDSDQNYMGISFENAYWTITNLTFSDQKGEFLIGVALSGYPSRESYLATKSNKEVNLTLPFGGSIRPTVSSELYTWYCTLRVEKVFPDGIPSSLDEAKSIIYQYIKDYLDEVPFTDVLEEGQTVYSST